MEDINLEDEDDYIIIPRRQFERLIGRNFLNDTHWGIFRRNFLFRFLYVPNHTLPSYFQWSFLEYQDNLTRDERRK